MCGGTSVCYVSRYVQLHKEYIKPDPPSVEFLRDPNILELFIRDMFSPARSISPNYILKYFFVLAYAASVRDDRIVRASPPSPF